MRTPLYYEAIPQIVLDRLHRYMREYLKLVETFNALTDPKRKISFIRSATDKSILFFTTYTLSALCRTLKLEIIKKDAETGEHYLGFHGVLLCMFQWCIDYHLHIANMAPRGFGKSFCFSTVGVLWLALHPHKIRNKEISYITSTTGMAKRRGGYVRKEFENNQQIIAVWGAMKGRGTWTREEMELANGVTLFFSGFDRPRGPHPAFIIVDDIETKKTARSETETNNIKDWLWFDMWGQIGAGDPFFVSGTNCGRGTMLDEIFCDPVTQKPRDGFTVFSFKACRKVAITGEWTGPGLPYKITRSIWASEWSNEKLKREKLDQMGDYAFDSELQNEPHGSGEPVIRREWIEKHWIPESALPRESDCDTYVIYDPAYSKKNHADYTGWSEIWVPRDGTHRNKFIVVEGQHARMSTEDKIQHIFWVHLSKHPASIFMEEGAIEHHLQTALTRESIERKCYPNLVPVKHKGEDKIARASSVQNLIQNGTAIFIRGKYPYAIDELVRLQEKNFHDDIADSIVYGLIACSRLHLPDAGTKAPKVEEEKEPSKIQRYLEDQKKPGPKTLHPVFGSRICP